MMLYIFEIDKKTNWNFFKNYLCYISKIRQLKIEKYLADDSKVVSILAELLLKY